MARLLLCLALAFAVTTSLCLSAAPWDDVPECRQVHESGYSVPTCQPASDCFKEAHEKAHLCIAEELKDKNVRKCQRTTEIQNLRKDWFKLSCRWHLALTKCMSGESVDSWQQEDSESRMKRWNAEEADQHAHHNHHGGEHAAHGQHTAYAVKASACWRDVYTKIEQCKQAGSACEHYKVCTGQEEDTESPDDSQAQWFTVVSKLKAAKQAKTQEYRQKIRKCVEAEAADPSTSEEKATTNARLRVRNAEANDDSASTEEDSKRKRHIQEARVGDSDSSEDSQENTTTPDKKKKHHHHKHGHKKHHHHRHHHHHNHTTTVPPPPMKP